MKGRVLGSGSQVTLVITTFDRPDYLEDCLASVKDQTLTGFRLVVLDNASAADYSGALDRFRELPMSYVRNETNIGAAGNIGKAMRRYSDSKYLVVFHDDDMMHPECSNGSSRSSRPIPRSNSCPRSMPNSTTAMRHLEGFGEHPPRH